MTSTAAFRLRKRWNSERSKALKKPEQQGSSGDAARAHRGLELKYRDVEHAVVQGLGRQLWKWAFVLEAKAVTGQAATKAEAVTEAERAIDKALAPKKLKLVRPERDR